VWALFPPFQFAFTTLGEGSELKGSRRKTKKGDGAGSHRGEALTTGFLTICEAALGL
jgi:hypothetical protein